MDGDVCFFWQTFEFEIHTGGEPLLCRKCLVAQVARVIDGTWIQSFALLTVSVQVKLGVSSVVTQTTHKFRRVLEGFLMHSFLVSPQVAFRRRMINALNLTRFDITIKAVLFLMCCPNVVCQFRLVPEDLITAIARRLHFSVDTPVVVIQCVVIQSVFSHELLSTDIANKFTNHFDEICGVFVPSWATS